jgi:hypothetical protein
MESSKVVAGNLRFEIGDFRISEEGCRRFFGKSVFPWFKQQLRPALGNVNSK